MIPYFEVRFLRLHIKKTETDFEITLCVSVLPITQIGSMDAFKLMQLKYLLIQFQSWWIHESHLFAHAHVHMYVIFHKI